MHDWERLVRDRLGKLSMEPATANRIAEEIAAMLEACEAEALEAGATREQAKELAEKQIPDWHSLARGLQRTEASASQPSHRMRRALVASMGTRRFAVLTGLGKDLWSSFRTLRSYPAFSLIAVFTLALGIGANTAIFSVVDAVLLEPLPYEQPEHLVRLWSTHPERSIELMGVSTGDVKDWRERNRVFEGIGAWYVMGRTLRGDGEPEVVSVARVSADFFPVLGTEPLLGRTFTPDETARAVFNSAAAHVGTDPVVVVSHGAWQRRFGSDPSIVGRTIDLERQNWRVVGIMPPDFAMPDRGVELWIPWSFQGDRPHDQRYLDAIARLKPAVSLDEAESQMNIVAAALGEELPESNEGWGVHVVPLQEDVVGSSRATLMILFAAVASLWLIASVNIASLQLVRIGERQKEIALRLALGASRGRLLRQFGCESLLLTLIGGALALPTALGAVQLLVLFLPEGIPRLVTPSLDAGLLAFTAILTLATGIFFGLVSVLAGPVGNLTATLKEASGRTGAGSPRWQRFRKGLVVSELAMAVVLLVAAGLLLRSFNELRAVDPGFRPEGVVVLPITLDNHEYDSGAKTRAYYRRLTEELAGVAGVVSVGGVTALPMSPFGPDFDRPIWAEGDTPPAGGSRRADVRMATPGYFETLGIRLLKGRAFTEDDRPDSPKVVMVSESLAEQVWPVADPIGKRLVIDYSSAGTYPYEVIGVVNSLRFYDLRTQPRPELYLPHAQRSYLIMNMAVRTRRDTRAIVPELKKAVFAVDPSQPAHSFAPLSNLVATSVARDRFVTLLMDAFAAVALVLALLGIFGVLSYHVGERTHELGIRTALGASRREIVSMMLAMGLRLTLLGITIGIGLALVATRLLSNVLFGVSPHDPMTFAAVIGMLALGALLACYLPARRAATVDPVVALRHD